MSVSPISPTRNRTFTISSLRPPADAAKVASSGQITAQDLTDALREHARVTRPRNSADSYEAVARRVGYHSLQIVAIWSLLGAPGYPPLSDVRDEVGSWISNHDWQLFLCGLIFVCVWLYGKSSGRLMRPRELARTATEWPIVVFGTVVRLLGVSVIGACAVLPAAFLVRMVGLTS